MQPLIFDGITVDELELELTRKKQLRLSVLRLDKIHAVVSGNKWFKLKYYLSEARSMGKDHIVTRGGAYSNHIVAAAAAAKSCGFRTTGLIRGEEPKRLSPTLLSAVDYGMNLVFINREEFQNHQLPAALREEAILYYVPEGGYGPNGVRGVEEILRHCHKGDYSYIACAVGTSTTMAGLIKASPPGQTVLGFSSMKNNHALETQLRALLTKAEQEKQFQLIHDYHFGGYAKHTTDLISFMNRFYVDTSIPTDFVYTAKLFYGIMDKIKNNFFSAGDHILAIHSGGLQGNLSLRKGTLIF